MGMKLPAVTGLRGVAALLVLLLHSFLRFRDTTQQDPGMFATVLYGYGWLGVDLFFVISGFVLAYALLSNGKKALEWRSFLARRFVRLAPPYYVSILAYFVLVGGASYVRNDPAGMAAHLAFQQTTFGTALDLNPVFWTLGTEFQFYLLFPLFLWLMTRRHAVAAAVALLAIGIAWNFALYDPGRNEYQFWVASQIVPNMIHFGLGVLAARVVAEGRQVRLLGAWTIPAAVAAILLWAVFLTYPAPGVPHVLPNRWQFALYRTVSAFGFTAILLQVLRGGLAARMLQTRPLQWLGEISYSLYLIHLPVILFLDRHVADAYAYGLTAFQILCVALSCAAAWILYVAVERPTMRWRPREVRIPTQRTPEPLPVGAA